MKKGSLILAGVLLSAGSYLFAQPAMMQGDHKDMSPKHNKEMKEKHNKDMSQKHNNEMHGKGFMFLKGVELTPEQKYNISIIRDEMNLEIRKLMGSEDMSKNSQYFTEKQFDKNSFLKDKKAEFDKHIEVRAKYMEQAYNLLSDEQRKVAVENMKNFKMLEKPNNMKEMPKPKK